MKLTTKIILGISIIVSSITGMFVSQEVAQQIQLYSEGGSFCKELGSSPVSPELSKLTYQALRAMNVPHKNLVHVYATDKGSCSTTWQIWLNEEEVLGPIEFVVFHECAHIALGHFRKHMFQEVSDAQARAEEVEADLLACNKLFELGMSDIIVKRIEHIKYAIDNNYYENDLDDHPTFKQMYEYMTAFARSKGIVYEANNSKKS